MRLVKVDLGLKKEVKNRKSTWITEIIELKKCKCVIAKLIENDNGRVKRYYLFTRDMKNDIYTQYLRLLPKRVRDQVLELLFEIALFN